MQIHSLRATFGKLQDETLSLSDGLNVIYAPNESGKSTWSRFLSCMLYGVNTRDRAPLADKNRYAPWNGSGMRGRMDFSSDGKEYTVTRDTRRATTPMGEFRCTCAGSADEVVGVDGTNLGETFLGIPREVYERSAFIGQNALAVDQNAELERRIASLITTGEEDTSYSESYDRLKKQLNRRKHNKTGQIPVLENEIDHLRRQADVLDGMVQETVTLEAQIAQVQDTVRTLQDQREQWQKIHAQARSRQLWQQRQAAEVKMQELRDKATTAKAVMEAHFLHNVKESELQKKLHPTPPKKPLPVWLAAVAAAVFLLIAVGLYLLHLPTWSVFTAVGDAVYFALSTIVLFNKNHAYHIALSQQTTGVASLQQQIEEYQELRKNATTAAESLRQYRELFDALSISESVSPVDLPAPPLSAQQVETQLSAAQEQTIRLRSRLDTLTGQLQVAGDRASIKAQLADKQEQLAAARQEYDAILLAMSVLDDANTALQSRFSPALGQRAAEIFHRLTNGNYKKVLLSRDFSLQAEAENDPTMRSIQLLSQGTADQLYLAVRLAICDMVLPADKSVPLVLDDALLSFDDNRLHTALDYLAEEAKRRQILLFTCQKREQAYLQDRDNVTSITL